MLKCASRRVLVQFAVLSVTRIFSESTFYSLEMNVLEEDPSDGD